MKHTMTDQTTHKFKQLEIGGKKVIALDIPEMSLIGHLSDPTAHKLINRIEDDTSFEFAYRNTLSKSFAHDLFSLINTLVEVAHLQGFDVSVGLENQKRFSDMQK